VSATWRSLLAIAESVNYEGCRSLQTRYMAADLPQIVERFEVGLRLSTRRTLGRVRTVRYDITTLVAINYEDRGWELGEITHQNDILGATVGGSSRCPRLVNM
jgi:hypothetical protein